MSKVTNKVTNKEKKHQTVKIGFQELDYAEFNAKQLTRVLHNNLWNMRGKYGYDNVEIIHLTTQRTYGEKGHPKEALTWNYFEETINVVAYSQNREVLEVVTVFWDFTHDFFSDPSNIIYNYEFRGTKILASEFMYKYLKEVLTGRLDYFGKHGLKYKFKIDS